MNSEELRNKLFNEFVSSMNYYKEKIIDSFVMYLGEEYRNQIENRINNIVFVPYINGPEYSEYFYRQLFLKRLEMTNILMNELGYNNIIKKLYVNNEHCLIKPKDEQTKKLLTKYFGNKLLFDLKTDKKLFANKELLLEITRNYKETLKKLNYYDSFDNDESDSIFSSNIGMFSYSNEIDEKNVVEILKNYDVKYLVPESIVSSIFEDRVNTIIVFPLLLANNQILFHEIEHSIEVSPLLIVENDDEDILYYKSGLCVLDTTANLENNSSIEEEIIDEVFTEIISCEVNEIFDGNIFSFFNR